ASGNIVALSGGAGVFATTVDWTTVVGSAVGASPPHPTKNTNSTTTAKRNTSFYPISDSVSRAIESLLRPFHSLLERAVQKNRPCKHGVLLPSASLSAYKIVRAGPSV